MSTPFACTAVHPFYCATPAYWRLPPANFGYSIPSVKNSSWSARKNPGTGAVAGERGKHEEQGGKVEGGWLGERLQGALPRCAPPPAWC